VQCAGAAVGVVSRCFWWIGESV